jgi:hypothetical protein
MRVIAAKKIFIFRSQMESTRRAVFRQHWWRLVVRQLIWRRLIQRQIFVAWRMMQCGRENFRTPVQLIINPAKNLAALKLKRRETETGEHANQNQAIPKLQLPFDGIEDFHSMQ